MTDSHRIYALVVAAVGLAFVSYTFAVNLTFGAEVAAGILLVNTPFLIIAWRHRR